ncbi:uncharacterized protein otu isoform X2 [Bactrocera oleae]|uniref:uncharacterized protein otu isoform X2 n=1 Tax=Bactrocera oleae TaxID=104688 RepID=UPI00387ED63C
MQRQFTSGSRQAPDPFDQFLEENNFYRKHTARDASCLFRVISEQMYDTQLHHLAIRKKCVRYMRKHRDYFAPLVERDLDEYLDDMSKPKTYGTLIELQAVGYMFQRNVLLFEPFNLGNFYSSRSYFNDVFRVFYTPERHFDSVFTCDYIKDAAICQAICYEILYKDLYKLPDVAFAVEHMLHSPTLDAMEYTSENNDDGYCTRIVLTDGRSFNFDLPNETNCILENYELCHFHHTNFPRLSDDLHREMKIHTNCDDYEKSALCKTAESLLPHKYISCVRQLLQEGITPFPYKVAKALDPNMYRNIEFDAWNEQRKEQKLQNWYNGDTNFKVPYESLTPLPPDQFKPWTLPYRFQRHMQKYSSVRLTRHYNYRFKLNGQFSAAHEYCGAPLSSNSKSSDYVSGIMDSDVSEKDEKPHYVSAASHHRNGCYYKLKQYTHFENFRAHTVEYCAMPLTVEHAPREQESKSGNTTATAAHVNQTNVVARTVAPETRIKTEANVQQQQQQQRMGAPEEVMGTFNPMEQSAGIGAPAFILPDFHYLYPVPQYAAGMPEEYYTYGYDPTMHPPPATALMPTGYYMYPPPGAPPATFAPTPNNFYMPTAAPLPPPLITAATAPHPASAVPPNIAAPYYQTNTHFGSMTPSNAVETASMQNAATQAFETPITHNRSSGQTPNMNTPVSGRINWDAKKSVEVSGVDLPTDVATLRHFYNLGLEYHLMQMKPRCNEDAANNVSGAKVVTKVNGGNQNEEVTLEPKLDSNNNSMQNQNLTTPQTSNNNGGNNMSGNTHTTHNQNSHNSVNSGGANSGSGKNGGGGGGHMHRRFPSRYFNSNKERPLFLRNQNNTNNPNVQSLNNNHNQTDYNNNSGSVGNKYASSLKSNSGGQYNSNRSNTPNSTHSHTSGHNTKAVNKNTPGMGNGVGSLAVSVAEHGMPSPQANFDNANGGGKMITHPPMPVYQTSNGNTLMAAPYNPYNEFNGDPSMSIAPPNTAAGGGIYFPMPMPAPSHTFSIYAPPQSASLPGASMSMHSTPTSTAITYGAAPNGGPPQQFMPSDAVPIQAPSNGYYPTPAELTSTEPNGGDGLQFQCIPYPGTAPPPPMPFYYTAGAAVAAAAAAAGGMAINGITTVQQPQSSTGSVNGVGCSNTIGVAGGPLGPQGYWCQPPNALLPLPTSTPQMNGSSACVSTSSNHSTPNMNANTTNSRSRDNK